MKTYGWIIGMALLGLIVEMGLGEVPPQDPIPTQPDSIPRKWVKAEGSILEFALWVDSIKVRAREMGQMEGNMRGAAQLLESAWEQRPSSPNDFISFTMASGFFELLGFLHHELRQYPLAIRAYERARAFAQQTGDTDPARILRIFQPLGSCYTRLGDYEKAEALLESGLAMAHQANNFEQELKFSNELGIVYSSQGKLEKAKSQYLNSLAMPEIPLQRKGMLHLNLGLLFLEFPMDSMKLDSSGKMLRRGIEMLESVNRSGTYEGNLLSKLADGKEGLAKWHFKNGDTAVALTLMTQVINSRIAAEEAGTRELAKTLVQLGDMRFESKDWDRALQAYQQALDQLLPGQESDSIALKLWAENALLDAFSGKARVLYRMGESERDTCLLKESLQFFDWAEAVEDSLEAEFLLDESQRLQAQVRHQRSEDRLEVYFLLHELTGSAIYAEEAFLCAEQTKANTLRRKRMLLNAQESLPPALAAETKEIIRLKWEIKTWRASKESGGDWGELIPLQDSLQRLYTRIAQQFPAFYADWRQPSVVSMPILRSELKKERQRMLAFFLGESKAYRFATDGGEVHFHRLPAADSLTEWAQSFWDALEEMQDGTDAGRKKSLSQYGRFGVKLSEAILGSLPIEWFHEGSRWVVIPDGELAAISLGALPISTPDNWREYGDYSFWGTRMAFTYAYSAALYQASNPLSRNQLSNPSVSLFDLPQTAAGEPSALVGEVAQHLGILPVAGGEATRAAFQQACQTQDAVIVWGHHPLKENPWENALLFAGGDSLSVGELWTLGEDWGLNWMLLWACQIGNGQYSKGEGMISQAMGLLAAGCPSLIASPNTVHEENYQWLEDFVLETEKGISLDLAILHANQAHFGRNGTATSAVLPHHWATMMVWGNSAPKPAKSKPAWWIYLLGGLILILAIWKVGTSVAGKTLPSRNFTT